MMKKYLLPAAVLLILVVSFFVYQLFFNPTVVTEKNKAEVQNSEMTSAANSKARATLTVTTVKPALKILPINIPANGSIAAWQEAIVGAESSGLMLKDVLVNVGDVVKRGQVLAKFSRAMIGADRAQAQANLAEAKMAATEAIGNASRARGIQDAGALSKQQLEQLFAAETRAKARVDAAKALMNMQQIKMKQTVVVSPDDGVISARSATVGAVVSSGTELFRLIRKSRLEWRAELTSADVGRIQPDMQAAINLPNGEIVKGNVRIVSPVVDAKTRNAIVFVDLPKSAKQAKLGMFARGQFILGESEVTTLPSGAIILRDGFSYVMRVEDNSHIREVKVNVGKRVDDVIELLDFTDVGGRYVASGGAFLVDGDIVKVVNASGQN